MGKARAWGRGWACPRDEGGKGGAANVARMEPVTRAPRGGFPQSAWRRVVFPAPEGPRMAVIEREGMWPLMSEMRAREGEMGRGVRGEGVRTSGGDTSSP